MSYLAHSKDFDTDAAPAALTKEEVKPGLLRRILKAMLDARERQADREMAYYLHQSGGRLTDDIERKVARDMGSMGFGGRT